MHAAERIAEFLLDIGAVRLNVSEPFTWTSGIKSPIYCDNRMIYSYPEARTYVADALTTRVKHLHIEPDVIAGTATAGIGWGALVADRMNLPFIYVRTKVKEHGAKKRIEGDLKPNQHVVVIEDLIATGGSSIENVRALREDANAVVSDIVSIFSYDFVQAREQANEHQVHLHPLSNIEVLLQVAVSQNRLTEDEGQEVKRFMKNPKEWRA